jgi:hypothetical protein
LVAQATILVDKIEACGIFFIKNKLSHQLLNSRIQIEQLRHDQVDEILPGLQIPFRRVKVPGTGPL